MSVSEDNGPSKGRSSAPGTRRAGPLLLLAGAVLTVLGGVWTDHLRPLPAPLKPVTGLQWWLTPVETNAFMKLPAVQGTLYGVRAVSANVAWAVGARSLIIGTKDGGRTWQRGFIVLDWAPAPPADPEAGAKSRPAAEPLRKDGPSKSQNMAPSPKRVAAASWNFIRAAEAAEPSKAYDPKAAAEAAARVRQQGPDQVAKKSSDVTATPANAAPPPRVEAKPSEVSAPSPLDPSQQMLLDVEFLTPDVGVAVGSGGLILRSDDSGANWRVIPAGTAATLERVIRTSSGRLVAVGRLGTLLLSDDQGMSWRTILLGSQTNLADVAFGEGGAGVVLDVLGNVFTTADNGNTWRAPEAISNAASESAADNPSSPRVAFVGSRTFIAAWSSGFMLRSVDGGDNWTPIVPIVTGNVYDVKFFDALRGMAVGLAAAFVTRDGGVTWTKTASPCADRLGCRALSISPDGTAYAIGPNGTVARGDKLGTQWSVLSVGRSFEDLAFADSQNGVVVGLGGVVLSTEDGGATWVARDSGVDESLAAVAFASREVGVAVGENGRMLRTRDHGNSWSASRSGDVDLVDISFDEEGRGIATDASGNALRTDNAGESWTPGSSAKSKEPDATRVEDSAMGPVVAVNHGNRREYPVILPSGELLSRAAGETQRGIPSRRALFTDAQWPWLGITHVAFDAAEHGIAVGDNGAVLRTENGGASWQRTSLGTALSLVGVRFTGKSQAVALATQRVFTTDDAGKTWSLVKYHRYPSPWLWLAGAILLIASALLMKVRASAPEAMAAEQSVADAAVSDSPIGWKDPDAVGLRDIALGLSRFLRNRRTQPPLTIAVTGEWGSGKSSLMNLLREDLKRYGFEPVWFNAWHHQSGENLLGSLLANIHAQGVPPWMTLAGLDFRLSLLFVRIRRFWLRLALTLFALAVVYFSSALLSKSVVSLWSGLIKGDGSLDLGNLGAATGLVGLLAAALAPLIGALRAVSAFGLQPGKLIAAVATNGQDETARLQPGARYRFAREFADFANGLKPRTLVIFIDDLDRCRPPNVIEVLEGVNFLVSSGNCVVVLGMAKRWVEACVGKAFEDLAAAAADESESEATASPAALAKAQLLDATATRNLEQRQFARNYLEKLINIEVRVPRLTDQASLTILEASAERPARPGFRRTFGRGVVRIAPALVLGSIAVALVLLGRFVAGELNTLNAEVAAQEVARDQHNAPQPPPSPGGVESAPVPQPSTAPGVTQQSVALESAHSSSSVGWYVGTGVPTILTLGVLVGLMLFVRKEGRTDDSPAFREALAILQPWIVLGGDSPRSLKRFVNHLRYVAMRFRTTVEPQTLWERTRASVIRWFDGDERAAPSPAAAAGRIALAENVLVALAAIYRCNEQWLAELGTPSAGRIASLLERDCAERFASPAERTAVAAKLERAMQEFNARFPETPLFRNEMLDRGYIVAFYDVMAAEEGGRDRSAAWESKTPTPIRPNQPTAA